MKSAIKSFLAWANQVSHGPNGKPSSGRVGGLLTVTVLQGVFIGATIMLIQRREVDAFVNLFEANAMLCAGLLGIAQIGKFTKGKEPEQAP